MKVSTMLALRILAALIGVVLVCAEKLLYEDRDKKLQNKLTDLWIQIDDHKNHQIAFMQTVARLTSYGLDRLLGLKLISLQSVGVSLCYSYASFLILLIYVDRDGIIERLPVFDDINVPLYLILGTLPLLNLKRRTLFLRIWFLVVIISLVLVDLFEYRFLLNKTWSEAIDLISQSRFFYLGTLIGIGSGILFIALFRGLLRSSSDSTSVPKLLAVLLVSCVCVVLFCLGPLFFERRFFSLDEIYSDERLFTGWIAITSNLALALMGALFIFIGVVMLAHRLLAPIINGFVYQLERLEIAGRQTRLRRVGWSLIFFAISEGQLMRILKTLIYTV